jgi:MFS transporter, DHA1 family, inner membrane transport protein
MVFVTGMIASALIPGIQTRLLATAGAAPTLGISLNASGFQIAAAVGAWLDGWVIDSGIGLRSIFVIAALVTAGGMLVAFVAWLRDRV